jgi:glycosyl hydrolase family 16
LPNNALSESFNNGTGAIGNAWNVDTSTKGEVKLSGGAALMEWASGKDAGHGYGTYTITAKLDGNQPGPAVMLWPGDDKWPGQEIDLAEITPDGSGRHYGNVHWNSNGSDAYDARVYDDVSGGAFHDYQVTWEPGRITFRVDGVEKGVVTDHVPADFDHGGMNNVIGFLNNNPNTSLTVSHVDFKPLGGGGGGSGSSAPKAAVEQAPAAETAAAPAPPRPPAGRPIGTPWRPR